MAKNHYEVLGLSGQPSSYTSEDVKVAYKKSLLLHHPDKNKDADLTYSIDDVTRAFKVLSDQATREAYDRSLKLHAQHNLEGEDGRHVGLETVDLDDMTAVENGAADGSEAWQRPCRCGRTFIIQESQLEQEADKGELFIPCEGCSLWLQVLFQSAD